MLVEFTIRRTFWDYFAVENFAKLEKYNSNISHLKYYFQ